MGKRRTALTIIAAGAIIGAIAWGFMPRPVPAGVGVVSRGPLTVTVEEEGRTRGKDRYVVSAPVAGFVERIGLEVGDAATHGQPLVTLRPVPPAVLDSRSRAEAEARVAAAEAALAGAGPAAAADADLAGRELARVRTLAETRNASPEELDRARSRAESADALLHSARFARDVARHELEAARTALDYAAAEPGTTAEPIELTAPVAGRVLKRFRESEGVVAAGDPLVELGDPRALEVEVDVLSSDAVRISPGTPVEFLRWGGDAPLRGVVRVVEPAGFTKISALGVEEQRAVVIADLTSPPASWTRLGDGYRVEASFILWHGDEVLKAPSSALFRHGDGWALFRVEGGRARLAPVGTGRRTGLEVQLLEGVAAGDEVVIHPGDDVADGVRLQRR